VIVRNHPGKRTQVRPNKGKLRRKSFSFATALKPSLKAGFSPWAFFVGLVLSSFSLSNFLRTLSVKMRFSTTYVLAWVLATISTVNAHINLVYPALRGPNVAKNQILFCGQ
jgi:hypothetical protein